MFLFSANKIKFLTSDSLCLIALYPPTVNLEHNYEICGGKLEIFCPRSCSWSSHLRSLYYLSVGTQTANPQSDCQMFIKYIIENYAKKIGAILCFVNLETVLVASKQELHPLMCVFRDRLPNCLPILRVKESSF